jgi:sporulation protein YlmC with PRC-barrel domain
MRLGNHHVITVALAALVCGAAAAQETELKSGEVRASHLLGAQVKRVTGDPVGEVKDLIVSADADIRLAVISVGGVLGVGGKTVALPFAEMMVAPDGGTLFLTMSDEQLESWPAFDVDSIHSDVRSAADDPVSPLGDTTFEASDFAEAAQPEESAQPAELAQPAEPAQTAETQQFSEAAPLSGAEQLAQAEQIPEAQQQFVQPDPLAQSEQLAQAEQLAEENEHAQTQSARSVSKSKAANQPASALIGARVIDSQQSPIGKVNDVVVTAEPPEVQVIVEVAETLGGDARLVAVPLPELTINEDSANEAQGQIESVETSLDVAQLDALPQYQRF